jgi:hypothetical protein
VLGRPYDGGGDPWGSSGSNSARGDDGTDRGRRLEAEGSADERALLSVGPEFELEMLDLVTKCALFCCDVSNFFFTFFSVFSTSTTTTRHILSVFEDRVYVREVIAGSVTAGNLHFDKTKADDLGLLELIRN